MFCPIAFVSVLTPCAFSSGTGSTSIPTEPSCATAAGSNELKNQKTGGPTLDTLQGVSFMHQETVQCCVVGGGPAGIMLGVLLARQGIEVLVLEKHADFLRDFRGDTIHPSTQELIYELGWIEEFQRIPYS